MKYFSVSFQLVLFGLALLFAFTSLQPSIESNQDATSFSVEKAKGHVDKMAELEHFTGSEGHSKVRNYLILELEKLGLQPHVQQDFSTTYNKGLSIAVPENIIAKIKGKNPDAPALMLLSHYDSGVHSSFGAADAASGVAAILVAVESYLASNIQPQQDIIILFSDTEEVGLNGANLFVEAHPWASNIGLVVNFEARGSAGPSSMVLEINSGNKELIKHFSKAAIPNPFANSLMYSVYKLLPNSTDSTVFREKANIPSIFFAFIDDHYNYHTALDTSENLSLASLNQQGVYALGLLNYFSSAPVSNLNSNSDYVYFNFPFVGMIYFSTAVVLLLIIVGFVSLFALVYVGIQKHLITLKSIGKCLLVVVFTLLFAFIIGNYGWKLIQFSYPQYELILQGFPYNGASYIIAFVCLAVAFFFTIFNQFGLKWKAIEVLSIAVFIWLVLSLLAYFYLVGASYFVIPAMFGLFSLWCLIVFKMNNQLLHFLLALPLLFTIVPFVYYFPVGLGLSAVFVSCLFAVLILLLISPLLANFQALRGLSFLLFCTSLFYLGNAHINSNFNTSQPRPSSLVFCQDNDANESFWASYDFELSKWNSMYFKGNSTIDTLINFESKYANRFKFASHAEDINIAASSHSVELMNQDSTSKRFKFSLTPNRELNRYEAFFDRAIEIDKVSINGKFIDIDFANQFSPRNLRFFNYYVANQEALTIEFTAFTNEDFNLRIYESAYDLINHPKLNVQNRPSDEIPTPFVLNDATILTYTIPFHD